MSLPNSLVDGLQTKLQSSGLRSDSTRIRKANINWVVELDRAGLAFGRQERRVLIRETSAGERLFIQYPGKESARVRGVKRPWDFRPKLIRANGTVGDDLSFLMIWDALFELEEAMRAREGAIRLLATLFYRMAFMLDHKPSRLSQLPSHSVPFPSDGDVSIGAPASVATTELFMYEPPKDAVDYLSSIVPECCGMSLEAFLHYNDLLAWNEDCKYYHREAMKPSPKWLCSTGRLNTLLTHINVIGFILQHIKFIPIFAKASQMRGVAPAENSDLINICSPFLS
jgi:hypothetical protein